LAEQIFAFCLSNHSFETASEAVRYAASACSSCFDSSDQISLSQALAKNLLGLTLDDSKLIQSFCEAFTSALQGMQKRADAPSRGSLIVEKAKDIIQHHYSEQLSLSGVAAEIGVSPNYLSDLFTKETGESYTKYLTKVRMSIAAHFIESQKSAKVAEIAERTGFVSSKHFLHSFKKYYGVTPSAYKSNPGGFAIKTKG
jgi:YesN/AraC family two-component response regulator